MGGRSRRSVRQLGVAARGSLAGLTVLLGACTGTPTPMPTPTPTADDAGETAPTGIRVGVVMPARSDPVAAEFHDADAQLAGLAERRAGDVASIRAVVPDAPRFEPDIAALLVDEGAVLVCILGSDGARTARALSSRFPAARFCALGEPSERGADNVDLFEVAHAQIGHVLGVAVGTAARGAPVGLVLGDDSDARALRRAGARAALDDAEVVVDATVRDAAAAAALVDEELERGLGAVLVDVADPGVAAIAAGSAPAWVGPRGVAVEAPEGALVRWSLRVDVIVAEAVNRLVGTPGPLDPPLGFAEQLFRVTFADDVPDQVRSATEEAAAEFARGTRDPLRPRTPPPSEPSD